MPISINWATLNVYVPQSYLTLVSGTIYDFDTDQFRKDIGALLDDEDGIPFLDAYDHVAGYTVVGVTYIRKVEMINGYSVEFEDGQYTVRLQGSNNNIFDVGAGVLVQNQVQVIPNNSAGFIQVSVGSGLSLAEQAKLDAIYNSTSFRLLTKALYLAVKK